MPFLDLAPVAGVAGTVTLPGSKSISNRTLLLAALAEGGTEVRGLLESDDTARMLEALAALGIRVERVGDARDYRVAGAGGRVPASSADLFLGNAGTAFRPLVAVLALAGGTYRLAGVARMHERPIGDLVDALRPLGADIRYLGAEGFPPLEIRPFRDTGAASVSVRGNVSSQFLTALLMALPLLRRPIAVEVAGELISKPYVEITLNLMERFGVAVRREGWSRFVVPADARYRSPGVIHVEGDASSASYFLAAGAVGGGPVRVAGVGRASIQGDVRFVEVLERMGARVTLGDDWIETRGRPPLRALDADLNHIPDAAMTAAVLALFADGPSTIRNVASWRVKETDRLAAMAAELRKVGAAVEEGADSLRIAPPAGGLTPGAAIDTYDDHRMAMCFSLVCLAGVPVRINDPGCVAKTFPGYFDALRSIVRG
ncbi:MAG: 3-phosphoshikimate 1-carboxyvinyltransferase [Burkholderiales bacterium]|nr:3-phosphoshikimate 1-carboxyvinyltransferase [Burkholderiales bacterium]